MTPTEAYLKERDFQIDSFLKILVDFNRLDIACLPMTHVGFRKEILQLNHAVKLALSRVMAEKYSKYNPPRGLK